MSSNLGIVVPSAGAGKLAPAKPVDLPEPKEGEILFRVEAAAQNPVDQYQADMGYAVSSFPIIVGVDAAGVVEKVGPGVTGFAPGDRIATMTPLGKSPAYGVYQQHALTRASGTVKIPSSLSFDAAATLPLAYYTAAIGLHTLMEIPIPLSEGKITPDVGEDEWILVWGGSSSVGAAAVQLAKVAGFRVVATASKANWEYVKSLGADVVLDYHDKDIVEQIRATANLSLVYDAISQPTSIAASIASLSSEGGKIAIVLPYDGVIPDKVEILTVQAGALYNPDHAEELNGLREYWQALVGEGRLKPHPVKVMPNGLNGIDEGFDLQRQKKISGVKLVYHPQETKA